MVAEQLELTMKGAEALPPWFIAWVHSPAGREIAGKFIRLAWGIKLRGFAHYSHWAIGNKLRWHYDMKAGPDASGYKVNNNCLAYLARFAEIREPRLKGFFRLRKLGARKVQL